MSVGFMNFKVIFIALMVVILAVYIRTSCKLYLIKKISFCNLFIPKTEPVFFLNQFTVLELMWKFFLRGEGKRNFQRCIFHDIY